MKEHYQKTIMYISLYCKSIVVKMFLCVFKKNEKRLKKIQLQKNITKKIQPKIQLQKMSGQRKDWVKGEEEPIEINCLVLLPESFSFPFMKLYRNVFQIKTYCHIQLWLLFLYLFRVMAF